MADRTTRTSPHPLEFAGYDLVRRLGRGGMGEVWSVVRKGLCDTARPLAVKVMLPELSEDEDFRETFISEGRITMQLSSSNIVPIYQLGRREGLLFMEMERVDGVNLADFQRRSRNVHSLLPLDIVAYITGEIFSALFVAHEHLVVGRPAGVIHRDVKPGNILVSSTGDIRLIDFGIARPIVRDRSGQMPNGTWRYMAPEQARGRAERASDLFAVGVILHELLSGAPMREGALPMEQLYRTAVEYDQIPQLERVIPAELERLRQGLLEPDPSKRIRSAEQAMQCLSEWPGYRYARLRISKIYEAAIGTRSSGFTDAHAMAQPSFLLQHRSKITHNPNDEGSDKDDTFVYRRADVEAAAPDGSNDNDDDAAPTARRMPWLRREPREVSPPTMSVPTATPVQARSRISAAFHPAADEPSPRTRRMPDAREEQPKALTPTHRLSLPVGGTDTLNEGADSGGGTAVGTAQTRDSAAASGQLEVDETKPPPARTKSATRPAIPLLVFAALAVILAVSVAWAQGNQAPAVAEEEP